MENGSVLRFCLLLLIGTAAGQSAPPLSSERLLPQWLTGLIAISSFLLLVFIGFMVKKMWCEKSSGRKANSEESVRENEHGNVYETNMDALRRTKSAESKNETWEDEYETSLNVLRSDSRKPRTENIYETCEDDYETSVDVLRNQSRRNVYVNNAMDRTENKSTSM